MTAHDGMREVARTLQKQINDAVDYLDADAPGMARAILNEIDLRPLLSSSAAASGVVGEARQLREALEWASKELMAASCKVSSIDQLHLLSLGLRSASERATAALSSSRSAGGSEVATRADDGPTAPTDR